MNKKISNLLFIILSFAIFQPSYAEVCFKHWTRAEAGTSGKYTFNGITPPPPACGKVETYDNPVYYSLKAAQTGFVESNPAKGRFSGALPVSIYKGPMTFDFFEGKDQIKIIFDKNTGKASITGGKGCYVGLKGTATRKQIGNTSIKVFEWKFCAKVAPKCTPK
jgi:hypothetical protein